MSCCNKKHNVRFGIMAVLVFVITLVVGNVVSNEARAAGDSGGPLCGRPK